MSDEQEIMYMVQALYLKDSSWIQFKDQKRAECVKKSWLTHSALLISSAKNANLTANYEKSVMLCDLLTHNIRLFPFYIAETQRGQIFFNPDCKFSCKAEERPHSCEYIPYYCRIADIRREAFVLWDLISFWIEHWHLVYIRYP